METEEQLAVGQKTWNESLKDRKDNQKNFSSSSISGARVRESMCVTGVLGVRLSADTTDSLIFV